jgi:hypothetical protein
MYCKSAIPYSTVLCCVACAVPAVPYLTLPYLTLPYLTLPYLTLPYLTLPYLTLPYLTVPYRTVPYRTVPYCTVLYRTVLCSTIVYCTTLYRLEGDSASLVTICLAIYYLRNNTWLSETKFLYCFSQFLTFHCKTLLLRQKTMQAKNS